MILKYLQQTVFILLWGMLLSSCLGSGGEDFDLPKDAQIYSFNMSSVLDSNLYLNDTKFSIDQINGKIFNRDSLPYLFDIDSIELNISGNPNMGFSNITINLVDNDSSYVWNGSDSIAFKRFKSIETTAFDGKTMLKYDVSINIHQQDPLVINWNLMTENQLPNSVNQQKTISFKEIFYTYYFSGEDLLASKSASNNGVEWNPVVVSGLPSDIILNSIVPISNNTTSVLYAVSESKLLYKSDDGTLWEKVEFEHPVVSVFGVLPSFSGDFAILFAAETEGETKYATTEDFSDFKLWNNLNADVPVRNFSAVSLENPTVYAAKYIILYGGETASGTGNEKIWIIQEKEDPVKGYQIATISPTPEMDIVSGELFLYDKKVYLLLYDGKENLLYYSNNYGKDWIAGGDSQAFPENFKIRKRSSVITDNDNFIWVFGGESGTGTQIRDVWRGRLNKLAK